MPMTRIDDCATGMILDADLIGEGGRVLLPAGACLSDSLLAALKGRGVGEISIRGQAEDSARVEEFSEKILIQSEEYVRNFFMFLDLNQEAAFELYRLCLPRVAARIAKGWTPPAGQWEEAPDDAGLPPDLFFRDEGALEDLIAAEASLASFPDVYLKLLEVLNSPHSTLEEAAGIITKDVGLAAKILKLVNSPFYGAPSAVDSIPRAVMILGLKEISALAMGVSAIAAFKDIAPKLVNMRSFWSHSFTCAVLAKILAGMAGGVSGESMFTAALLHDVGRLAILKKLPHAATAAMLYARSGFLPLIEGERDVLGFDHAVAGGRLLAAWKLPKNLCAAVLHHHDPAGAPEPREAAIIQLADNLARVMEVSEGGWAAIPGVDPALFAALNLPYGSLAQAVADAESQTKGLLGAFFS
ncbi:MAG: HDOD domain-containing protein [Desulfovibrionaceae bacterium]|nr:HDOD domain-containing protein [Desulfovibrionaceae bacterium]MBF0514811.1 HDOD domain-containing protein [Desulfovibrionaceae bacterium]